MSSFAILQTRSPLQVHTRMFEFRKQSHLVHANPLELSSQSRFGFFQNWYRNQRRNLPTIEIKPLAMEGKYSLLHNEPFRVPYRIDCDRISATLCSSGTCSQILEDNLRVLLRV